MRHSPAENREADRGGILNRFRSIRTAVAASVLTLFGCATAPESTQQRTVAEQLSATPETKPTKPKEPIASKQAVPSKIAKPKPQTVETGSGGKRAFDLKETLRELAPVEVPAGVTAKEYLDLFHVDWTEGEAEDYLARLVNVKNGKLLGHTPKSDRDVIAGAAYVLAPDAATADQIRSALLAEKKVTGKNATEAVTVMRKGQGAQEFVNWVVGQLRAKLKEGKLSRSNRAAAAGWDFYAELLGQNAWQYLHEAKSGERLTDPKRLILGKSYYLKVDEAELARLYGLDQKPLPQTDRQLAQSLVQSATEQRAAKLAKTEQAKTETAATRTAPKLTVVRTPADAAKVKVTSRELTKAEKAAKTEKAEKDQAEIEKMLKALAVRQTAQDRRDWGNFLEKARGTGGSVGTAEAPANEPTPRLPRESRLTTTVPDFHSGHPAKATKPHQSPDARHHLEDIAYRMVDTGKGTAEMASASLNGREVTLDPSALYNLRLADHRLQETTSRGMRIDVISSHRSLAKQRHLYQKYNGVKPVAYPGTSLHHFGKAIDIRTRSTAELKQTARVLAAYGWVRPIANDPNHFEYRGATVAMHILKPDKVQTVAVAEQPAVAAKKTVSAAKQPAPVLVAQNDTEQNNVVNIADWQERTRTELGQIFLGLDKKHLTKAAKLVRLAEADGSSIKEALIKHQDKFAPLETRYYLARLLLAEKSGDENPKPRKQQKTVFASNDTVAQPTLAKAA